MIYTLKEVMDREISSYRPLRPGETYPIAVITFDGSDPCTTIWASESRVEEVEDISTLPQTGWLHMDDCNCNDCIDERETEEENQ